MEDVYLEAVASAEVEEAVVECGDGGEEFPEEQADAYGDEGVDGGLEVDIVFGRAVEVDDIVIG